MAGSCEQGTEPAGVVIGWKFLNQVSEYRVFKLWFAG